MSDPVRRSTTAFVKTARPELAGVVEREGLYTRLDGMSARTVAWIGAPAGSGKSTLAASYVAARNYRAAWYQFERDDSDIETFFHYLSQAAERLGVPAQRLPPFDAAARADPGAHARAFFRRLFAEAGAGAALVLDNLDPPAGDAALRRCIEQGLAQVPRHCAVIVTSRSEPPGGLARLRANGNLVCVGAEELRLTDAELRLLAERRGCELDSAGLARLQSQTQGWAAAAVLMLEHAKMTGEVALPGPERAPEVLFDYLASEIFDRFEPASRQILMRIACLPRFTAEAAVALSGEAPAARLLLNLSHNDYFVRQVLVQGQRVYAFHPLYRDFLLRVAARDLPQAVAAPALVQGGQLLWRAGLAEDALTLFAQAGDWVAAASLLSQEAAPWLAQGRRAALLGWVERLPPALWESDARLVCADAACRLPESTRAAQQRFERAWQLSREQGDAATALRACSGIVESIVADFDDLSSLDPWLPELAQAAVPGPLPQALVIGCLLRAPPRLAALCAGAGTSATACAWLQLAALWRGHPVEAAAQGSTGEPHPAWADALRLWLDGDPGAAWQALAASDAPPGAAPDRVTPWPAFLRAALALARDDFAACAQALESVDAATLRRGERAVLHLLAGGLAASRHDGALALREARGALHVALEVGAPWFEALARLALAQAEARAGDAPAAAVQLAGAEAVLPRLGPSPLDASVPLVRALLHDGSDDAALEDLRRGLGVLRRLGVRQVPGLAPGELAQVLAKALRGGVEPDAARALVRRLGLPAPVSARRLRSWAWRYELCTLGPFELRRDGQPLESPSKAPGRPLELLKVLVAFGGRHVRVDEITDALWPHVDGDYAYKSFTATLHRLRRLLGEDDALLLREGRLGLNGSLWWVDAWAVDQLVAEVDACIDAQSTPPALQALAAELLALYRGPFLADESDQSAYLARREQLRSRLARALAQVARAGGPAAQAREIDAWSRCIEADELHEPFHRELLLALERRDDRVRAAAVYERLVRLLAARLHSQPSPETTAIYRQMAAR